MSTSSGKFAARLFAALALAAASSGLALPVTAEEKAPPPTVDIDLMAKKVLQAAVGKTLDAGQINMLHAVAHQHVVALVCRGFKIDPARFEREMNLVYYDEKGRQKSLSSDELHEIEKQAMVGFGIVMGSQIAIASLDTKAFCEHASEEKASADMPHLIWSK